MRDDITENDMAAWVPVSEVDSGLAVIAEAYGHLAATVFRTTFYDLTNGEEYEVPGGQGMGHDYARDGAMAATQGFPAYLQSFLGKVEEAFTDEEEPEGLNVKSQGDNSVAILPNGDRFHVYRGADGSYQVSVIGDRAGKAKQGTATIAME